MLSEYFLRLCWWSWQCILTQKPLIWHVLTVELIELNFKHNSQMAITQTESDPLRQHKIFLLACLLTAYCTPTQCPNDSPACFYTLHIQPSHRINTHRDFMSWETPISTWAQYEHYDVWVGAKHARRLMSWESKGSNKTYQLTLGLMLWCLETSWRLS